ncbi:protein CUSTOS isoform X2 [Elephas maximus indicus]|uniref:protein CUSTOS isoform X2 n=1 Tax=Elephas maximus indicus TaxID=99487 RepID=UPI002115EC67|nr:protein CUSTOS isoform X2 [Elephas maximus indicus]
MAAPTGAMSDSDSSSSSSSDAEELARCREAAMPAWGLEQRPKGLQKPRAGAANNQLPATQRSLRLKVDEHEQDGNELQTTPEFRAHVAKKLGALLDSSITISEMEKEPTKAKVQKAASEDDGFRLFFTSIPGDPEKETSPQPHRKRPPSSSSEDSDEEWQRCREAAVSASDIFQESAIHGPIKVEKEAKKKKKKWKKKAKEEANASVATATTTTSGTAVQKQEKEIAKLSRDQASLGTKKKKKAKTSEAPQFLPAKSAAAVLAN